MLQLEIRGLKTVAADSTSSARLLKEELCRLIMKQIEIRRSMNSKREEFLVVCLDFQKGISKRGNDEASRLLEEKEFLENEIHNLSKKNNALQNSMLAFVEEVLQDLQGSICALQVEIHSKNFENGKLLKDIDLLRATLLSAISIGS